MPTLSRIAVLDALLWLRTQGAPVPNGVIGFMLGEDLTPIASAHPMVVAYAVLKAADQTQGWLEHERCRCQVECDKYRPACSDRPPEGGPAQ